MLVGRFENKQYGVSRSDGLEGVYFGREHDGKGSAVKQAANAKITDTKLQAQLLLAPVLTVSGPVAAIYGAVQGIRELIKGANKNKKQCKKAKEEIRHIHGLYSDVMLQLLNLRE